MTKYFKPHPWLIQEEVLHPNNNRFYESIMSLGNGYMGLRGNFEEHYSGDTHKGTYYAGVYYPDKTRVGWWKNGYPESFAKVPNGIDFIGLDFYFNGIRLDLNSIKHSNFNRTLNMKEASLERSFDFFIEDVGNFKAQITRFLSFHKKEIGAIKYSITAIDGDSDVEILSFLNGMVRNEDSNYDEDFWLDVNQGSYGKSRFVTMKTKKTDFYTSVAMKNHLYVNGKSSLDTITHCDSERYTEEKFEQKLKKGETLTLTKFISYVSSRDYDISKLSHINDELVNEAYELGFDKIFEEHKDAIKKHWNESDVVIEGDDSAQQGIRFNIYQLYSTYTGKDSRLNIGPKGFTGEKYGGSTYWDTEAYCMPFYLATSPKEVGRNLLLYRFNQLQKARENARKLGFNGALYPMVTMNGEESHNEWEITFEEIHRNGAMSYAIYNYTKYNDDKEYVYNYGIDVLVEIARFWTDRVNYSTRKNSYVILGVTGPNEYENNVNNNWYTNRMAKFSIDYALEILKDLKNGNPGIYDNKFNSLMLSEDELEFWHEVSKNLYFPYDEELGIIMQQDGYMDKEQILVSELDSKNLPLNQKWSWDRILRSCFIKQADVVQGIYFFINEFDKQTIKKNFDFYEPRTVHESSLSPSIYSIIASEIGYESKAYELYLRTARLDLDNYNNDTEDGLHITSMTGSWLSIVHGFSGFRIVNNMISLRPFVPSTWDKYSYKIGFRDRLINIHVEKTLTRITLEKGERMELIVHDKIYSLENELTIF
jgi:maltose phosphorylase